MTKKPTTSSTEPDAWEQYVNLVDRFTHDVVVRPDLAVTAHAHKRKISLEVSATSASYETVVSTHNVGTMREFAEAILVACDFVDDANPLWASIAYEPGGIINPKTGR